MNNYSILELFRHEVETNVAILKQYFAKLKNQQHTNHELEQAIQAAHSLWGTTRIVEMETAANLVKLIKDTLIAIQKHHLSLKNEEIETLLHANDLLLNMSKSDIYKLDNWINDHVWDWNTTEKIISSLLTRSSDIEEVENQEEHISDIGEEKPLETVQIRNSDDDSMMELFKIEVEAQVNILNNGLLVIENHPESLQELEALMRAAHSIKGAARIVNLDGVVELAHEIENCFVAAQNRAITLTPDDVDWLLQGVDLLQSISQLSSQELSVWLKENQNHLINIRDYIVAIFQSDQTKPENPVIDNSQKDESSNSKIVNTQSLVSS